MQTQRQWRENKKLVVRWPRAGFSLEGKHTHISSMEVNHNSVTQPLGSITDILNEIPAYSVIHIWSLTITQTNCSYTLNSKRELGKTTWSIKECQYFHKTMSLIIWLDGFYTCNLLCQFAMIRSTRLCINSCCCIHSLIHFQVGQINKQKN